MKKKYLVLVVGIVPLLTACGSSNTLSCVRNSDGALMERIVEFDSKGEKVTDALVNYSIDLSGEDLDEYGCESMEECLDEFAKELDDCKEDKNYYDCKIAKRTKNSMTIQAKVVQEVLENEFKNKNYDEVKEMLEEEGLECK